MNARACMPEWSKGEDLRSSGFVSAWVQTPLHARFFFFVFWCFGVLVVWWFGVLVVGCFGGGVVFWWWGGRGARLEGGHGCWGSDCHSAGLFSLFSLFPFLPFLPFSLSLFSLFSLSPFSLFSLFPFSLFPLSPFSPFSPSPFSFFLSPFSPFSPSPFSVSLFSLASRLSLTPTPGYRGPRRCPGRGLPDLPPGWLGRWHPTFLVDTISSSAERRTLARPGRDVEGHSLLTDEGDHIAGVAGGALGVRHVGTQARLRILRHGLRRDAH